MEQQVRQFNFAGHQVILRTGDLLGAPVEVIVNPANGGLSHGGGLAEQIVQQGGDVIQQECDAYIARHGMLESGTVTWTSAGRLPYRAVIHAVGPRIGHGEEQARVAKAVNGSLQLCREHGWNSIAFPAISAGLFGVPVQVVAKGFVNAITGFVEANVDTPPATIMIYVIPKHFPTFAGTFGDPKTPAAAANPDRFQTDAPVGFVDLSDDADFDPGDEEIDDWFA